MKVMVLVKASKQSEAGAMPSPELLAEMGRFNEELSKAGVLLAADGLHPSSKGARVLFSGTSRTVIDGPFAETKELVAGFWLWNVSSLAEAIDWVKRCPNPMPDDSEIEIRPVFEFDDFGPALTPELRERENRLRERLEQPAINPDRFEAGRAMLIAGISATYTFESRVNIPAQWQRFAPHIGQVPGQVGHAAYGVCWNYQPASGFDYLCGVEVADGAKLPADFSQVRLAAGRYAVFAHRDHVSTIPRTIDAIWNRWLPASGFSVPATPCFERYTEEFDPQTGRGGMEIWVPIAEEPLATHRIVSAEDWLAARKSLLAKEKELTRMHDQLSAERRQLPWVKVEKKYVFDGPRGKETLANLFDRRSQLIVYHFMFGPAWEEGCPGCSFLVDHIDGARQHIEHHDVSLIVVSRASFSKIAPFQQRMGWRFKWVSAYENDFNFDYHVTATPEEVARRKMFYNYEIVETGGEEQPGVSVFYRDEDANIFHTYSSYGRGPEPLIGAYNYLDLTPKGRNETGPHGNLMDWVRHHDRYENPPLVDLNH